MRQRREALREYRAEWHRDYRTEHKLQSVSVECAQPACPEFKTRCARHHLANRERSARCWKRKLTQGTCSNCSQPVESPSRYFCFFHREKANANSQAHMQRKRLLKQAQRVAAAA